jgi:hypothetical protein
MFEWMRVENRMNAVAADMSALPPAGEVAALREALRCWFNAIEEYGIQSAEMVPYAERLRDLYWMSARTALEGKP